jgi:hypothetical protein
MIDERLAVARTGVALAEGVRLIAAGLRRGGARRRLQRRRDIAARRRCYTHRCCQADRRGGQQQARQRPHCQGLLVRPSSAAAARARALPIYT